MAVKVGEVYGEIRLEYASFFKDLDRSKEGLSKQQQGFLDAINAAGKFNQAIEKARSYTDNLKSSIQNQTTVIDDYKRKLQGGQDSLAQLKQGQSSLGATIDSTASRFKALPEEIRAAESALEAARSASGKSADELERLEATLDDLVGEYDDLEQTLQELTDDYEGHEKAVGKAEKAVSYATREVEQAQKVQAQMQDSLEKVNKEIAQQTSLWTSLARSAGTASDWQMEAGKNLTKWVSIPLATGAAAVSKFAIDWESAWAGVQKTNDGTAEQMATLQSGIRDLAKDIPQGTTELASLAESAGQLGIQVDNVLGFTKVMADLKETTNLGDEGATQLARLANITQMSQKDFDRLGSAVVDLGNNYATTEAEIVSMSLRLAGAGKQVHMSEADILGFAAALSSVGIEADAGGSAFSKVMVEMQLAAETGGKKLNQFASVAGMTAEQFKAAFQEDAADAMISFISGLESGGESAIKVLNDMGITEVRMRDALLRASSAGDTFTSAIQTSNQAWRENTALAKEASVRYKTFESRLKTTGNKAKDMGITLGNSLMPYLEKGLGVLDGWVGKLSEMDEGQQQTIITMGGLAAATGPVLSVLGKANGVLKGSIGKFRELGEAAKNGGLLGSVGGLLGPAGIAALVAGLGFAAYKLYDIKSGAQAARQAVEALNKTGEEWKNTQAKTIFDTGNDPFERLRVDRSLFGGAAEMGRKELSELARLEKQYNKLMEKGDLSEKDQQKLDKIIQRRLEIRADFVVDDITGFDELITNMQAEIERLAQVGLKPGSDLFGDTLKGLAQGQTAEMKTLDDWYTTQYADIQKLDNQKKNRMA